MSVHHWEGSRTPDGSVPTTHEEPCSIISRPSGKTIGLFRHPVSSVKYQWGDQTALQKGEIILQPSKVLCFVIYLSDALAMIQTQKKCL